MILVDTNILVRLADQADPQYKTTHQAISGLWRKDRKLFVSDQALQEFWVVATRATTNNGLGMDPAKANGFLSHFMRTFIHIADPAQLFEEWRKVVNTHEIKGIRAYDARFIALVQATGLRAFMTYNLSHFSNFGVTLVNPSDVSTW